MRPLLKGREIAELFDRVDENILCVFGFNPNETIKEGQGIDYTLTIKDRFKIKFKNKNSRFDDLEECGIEFRAILQDNMIYIYKLHDIQSKLKKIVDPVFYEHVIESKGNNVGLNQADVVVVTDSSGTSDIEDKLGKISGQADATSNNTIGDSKVHKQILSTVTDKNEDAFMQHLSPTVRQFQQSYNKNLTATKTTSVSNVRNTSKSVGSNMSDMRNIRRIEAMNEIAALSAEIPRLIEEYLERFNVLFYV